ncbi:hypothetical protein KQX54_018532 [Cotesia glomerata]|uniref:Aminomethyltransferase, mitochondrial n=1 Tax=Cotesia glomerata TaxID=32391 RepID=A0AAV7I7Q2_COTGL|nr:hypothetical protein KQX54_018532 [Cotesia glomerata]
MILKGKIVDFAGWLLPVQYKGAIAVSHQHTRTQASLFDVGHMLQTIVWGRNSWRVPESLTTADLKLKTWRLYAYCLHQRPGRDPGRPYHHQGC